MDASCSSKMSVTFQKIMLHYIPEDRTLNTLCLNIHATDASNLQSGVLYASFISANYTFDP
jgi:hypothetical protein